MVLLQSRLEIVSAIVSHSFKDQPTTPSYSKYSFVSSSSKKEPSVSDLVRFVIQVQQLTKNMFMVSVFSGTSSDNYSLLSIAVDYNQYFSGVKLPISNLKLLKKYKADLNGHLAPERSQLTSMLYARLQGLDFANSYHGHYICQTPDCYDQGCWDKLRENMCCYFVSKHIFNYVKVEEEDDNDDHDGRRNEGLIDESKLKVLREGITDHFSYPLGEKFEAVRPMNTEPVHLDTDLEGLEMRYLEEEIRNKLMIELDSEERLEHYRSLRGTPFGKTDSCFV